MPDAEAKQVLRRLPSVEELASELTGHAHPVAVAAARAEIEAARRTLLAGKGPIDQELLRERAAARAARLAGPSLRLLINATGVIVHTNLGRAPLASEAVQAVAAVAGAYSNLEYDLEAGERGSRQDHVEELIRELSGAEAAIAVNNNAAGVMLALAGLASGREVIVSRGQLVEIGGSFRVPEILEQSGASLVEVGTTNRTRLADYEKAIGSETAAILRVHQSNFRTVGFTEDVAIEELCALGAESEVPVIDDLGSGAVAQVADEPPIRRSVAAGAALVCCSADKLLGGPQAGIVAGRREAVDLCRSHPFARAVRIEKLQLAALEATLRLHRDQGPDAIPALRMISAGEEELLARARSLAEAIGTGANVERSTSRPGGGALPLLELEGPVCAIDPGEMGADELARRLRLGEPPVIARIHEGRVLLDPRTMTDVEAGLAAAAVSATRG